MLANGHRIVVVEKQNQRRTNAVPLWQNFVGHKVTFPNQALCCSVIVVVKHITSVGDFIKNMSKKYDRFGHIFLFVILVAKFDNALVQNACQDEPKCADENEHIDERTAQILTRAENGAHKVKIEYANQAPVHCSNQNDDESDYVCDNHISSLIVVCGEKGKIYIRCATGDKRKQ